MLEAIKQRIFPFIIALSALSVSASAAFYSVTGLSKLFAGASLQVIIMAGSLEIAKLVIASLLYQYWGKLNKLLKIYLSIATFVLILITSMGIYGFLSAAYQQTAALAGNMDAQIELLETKKTNYVQQLDGYNQEKSSIDQSILELREGLSNNVIQYRDKETGEIITTTSSSTRKSLERQLDQAIERQSQINIRVDDLNQKVFNLETEIVEVSSSNEVAGELGPLKYLSGITGYPMDKIVNILLLIIIFVFDPLAISLVIAANFAFAQLKPQVKADNSGTEFNEWDSTLNDGLDEKKEKETIPPSPSFSQLSLSFPPHSPSPFPVSNPSPVERKEVTEKKTETPPPSDPPNLSAWRRNKNKRERTGGSDDTTKRYF